MFDPLKVWSAKNRTPLLAFSVAAVGTISLFDWWHPTYISLGFLYIVPIMLAAGYIGRPAMVIVALVCAALQEAFGDRADRTRRAWRDRTRVLARNVTPD